MPSVITNVLGNLMLARYIKNSPCWLGLFKGNPGVLGSQVDEVTGGDYIRQRLIATTPGSKSLANSAAMTFDNLPACEVSFLGLANAQYSGNLYVVSAELTPHLFIPDSGRLVIAAGEFAIVF